MPAQFGLVLPLWSCAADDGALLERAAGAVGLDHVTAPAVTGPASAFRPACDPQAPHFHSAGGWHFPPAPRLYTGTARPLRARWAGTSDTLARLRERAARLGLRLSLRIEPLTLPALVEQWPHLARHNAWGQPIADAGPCPGNPDLRELIRATLADLARYEPAIIELGDWAPRPAAGAGPPAPLTWHPGIARLAAICFCPSCRLAAGRAGIDPDQAARSARVEIERLWAASQAAERELDPVLAAYESAQAADWQLWLAQLAAGHRGPEHFLLAPAPAPAAPAPAATARAPTPSADAPAPASAPADEPAAPLPRGWHMLARFAAPGQLPAPRGSDSHPPAPAGLALPAWRPAFSDAAELVRTVAAAAEAGVWFFDFEHLDEAPADAVTWVKQAVRYARRGS